MIHSLEFCNTTLTSEVLTKLYTLFVCWNFLQKFQKKAFQFCYIWLALSMWRHIWICVMCFFIFTSRYILYIYCNGQCFGLCLLKWIAIFHQKFFTDHLYDFFFMKAKVNEFERLFCTNVWMLYHNLWVKLYPLKMFYMMKNWETIQLTHLSIDHFNVFNMII